MSRHPPALRTPSTPTACCRKQIWLLVQFIQQKRGGPFLRRHEPAFPWERWDEPSGPRKITGGALKLRSEVRKEGRRNLGLETMLSGHFEMVSLIRHNWHQGPLEGQVQFVWLVAMTPVRSGCEFLGGKLEPGPSSCPPVYRL